MIKLADVSFYTIANASLGDLLTRHKETLGYTHYIKDRVVLHVVKHIAQEEQFSKDSIAYFGLPGNNGFFHFPLKALRLLKKLQPDVVIVQGMGFPVQMLWLRLFLGRKTKILLQHHGEQPMGNIKSRLQKWAVGQADGCLFTAMGNTAPWVEKKIIANDTKCYELPEASTTFKPLDRKCCKDKLELSGDWNFLWVGRLNANKDPMMVIRGFERYLDKNQEAKLYMIFSTEELLPEIRAYISQSPKLHSSVLLVGKTPHHYLEYWYNAADFYISGSHREGSGFALIEAIACGCIPVVTDIPPFRKLTDNGAAGILYTPGDEVDLAHKLHLLKSIDRNAYRQKLSTHFTENLSFKTIADKLFMVITDGTM